MENPNSAKQVELRAAFAKFIEERINPNLYAVCTVKQSVLSYGHFIKGDTDRYTAEAERFVKRLSKRLLRWHSKERKPLIPMAVTLELGKATDRYHLNFLIRKPDWIDFKRFDDAFRAEWNRIPWSRRDVYHKIRYSDCVSYAVKDGSDSLVYITH